MTDEDVSPLEELADDIVDELDEIEQRSPLARTLITVAVTVVVVAVVIGVLLVVSLLMRETETATSTVDAADLPQVALRADAADVTVVEGEGEEIRFEADVTSGLLGTDYEIRRRGAELEIVSGCFALLNPGCGVDVQVTVPEGLPVELTNASGDVVADGLGDRVLTVVAGSGDVTAHDLEVDELSATTESGGVSASFASDPFAVKATTDSGGIDVTLPGGDEGYQVDVRTESGDVSQDVESEDDAQRFVRLHSDSGDVRLARE